MIKKLVIQIGIKFLAVLCGVFTTRWQISNFSATELANYTLILSYNSIILMATAWGLPQITQKFFTNYSKSDTNKDNNKILANYWSTSVFLRILSYFVGLVLIFVTYPLSQTNDLLAIIQIFTAQWILVADLVFKSIADSNGTSWKFSITDLLGKLLIIFGVYFFGNTLFTIFGNNIYSFGILSITAYTISLLVDSLWQKQHYNWGKIDFSLLKTELGAIGFLTMADLVNGLYSKTDVIFLKVFGFGNVDVISYANAYKLFDIATIIPSLAMPILATVLRKKLNNQEITKKNLIKFYGLSLVAGLLLCVVVNILAGVGVWLIDPQGKYLGSIYLLRILSLVLIVLFPTLLSSDLLNVSGLENQQFWSKLVTCVLAIILYIYCIPIFGVTGSAVATVIYFGFEAICKSWFVYKYVK